MSSMTGKGNEVLFMIGAVLFSYVTTGTICSRFVDDETFASSPRNETTTPLEVETREMIPLLMGGLIGYWAMGLLCLTLDLASSKTFIERYKTQGERNLFTRSEWFEAVRVSMTNILFFAPLFVIPLWIWGGWRERYHAKWAHTPYRFDLTEEIFNALVHGVVVDTVFYWTHRLIHIRSLYAMIHKKHHLFKAPVAVASMYAHWIEFTFGNLAGVVLGPYVTCCHVRVTIFWICLSLFTTGGSHSGWTFFAAKGHDLHHQYLYCNYGVGGVWDTICRTTFDAWWKERSERKKKRR